jgi:hypothetical protein
MRCKEIEESIYLYDELSTPDKKIIAKHLLTCTNCRRIWSQREHYISATQEWQSQAPVPDNVAQLTHKIMASLPEPGHREKRKLSWWIDSFNTGWVRYSLASISIALIISLALESHHDQNTTRETKRFYEIRPVVLNTDAFLSVQISKSKNPSTKQRASVMACVQNKNCPPFLESKKKIYDANP